MCLDSVKWGVGFSPDLQVVLIAKGQADTTIGEPKEIPIEKLFVSPFNVRYGLPVENVDSLAADIKAQGIQSRLKVRPSPEKRGMYEIVAGARRFAAAQKVGLKLIPCDVKDMTDAQALAISFSENEERQNMDPVMRAMVLKNMLTMEVRGKRVYSEAQELAAALGKSKQIIADNMAILRLDEKVRALVRTSELSYTAAVAMGYKVKDPEEQRRLTEYIRDMKTTREQHQAVLAVSEDRSLLQLSKQQFRQNLEAILSDFTLEQRKALRSLYKRVGLDPDSIKWSSMTAEQYAKDVATKQQYLRKRRGQAVYVKEPVKKSKAEPEVEVRLEDLPTAAEQKDIDREMNEIFEGLKKQTYEAQIRGETIRIPLGELVGQGITEADLYKLQGAAASYIHAEDLIKIKKEARK